MVGRRFESAHLHWTNSRQQCRLFLSSGERFTPCTPSRGMCGAHVGTGRLRRLVKSENMTLAQTAGTLPAVLLSGRKGNHTTLDSNAKRVSMPRTASMSMLVSMPHSGLMPRLGSIPRGWARLPLSDASASKGCVPNLLSAGESNLIAQ